MLVAALAWLEYRTTDPFFLTLAIVLLGTAAVILLISMRRRTRQKITEITDSIPCVVYQFRRHSNGDYRFTFVSAGIRELVGLEPEQAVADVSRVFEQVLPEDLDRLYEAIEHSAERLEPFRFEFRARHADGSIHWMRANANPRRKSNGTVVWNGYWVDITQQKEARRALTFSEQHRKMAVEVSGLGTWTWDVPSGKVTWSGRTLEIFGIDSAEEPTFDRFLKLVHHEDRARVESAIQESMANHAEYQVSFRLVRPDGTIRWISAAGRVFYDNRDEPLHMEGIVLDISEYKVIEERLASSVALLTTQQEVSPDGILATDSDFRVISFNRRFAEMWQIDPSLLESGSGQSVLEHMRTKLADPERFSGDVDEVLDKYQGKSFEEFQLADGRILEEFSAPMPDAEERDRGRVWYYRDVTHRKRSQQALHEAKEEAQAANRAKSNFLATMSHEIRTPMNGVLGMLELLSLGELDAEQRTTVRVIHESTRSLQRLIDDILDLSKIEADKLDIHPEPASIEQLMSDVHALFSGAAISRGLDFSCSANPDIPPAVCVDSLRLKQILNNLISNALKFTPSGEIRVRAERVRSDDENDRVRFSVADTGIGIAPDDQARLFEPFTQADETITRNFGGTGLGLTICKRLVELMGGVIELDSAPGRGTTMTFTMPLERADADELPEDHDPEDVVLPGPSFRRGRPTPSVQAAEEEGTLVLVVDDHPTNRLVLVRQLDALGYAAETAEDGEQALDLWKTGRYGLLLLDVNMPRMDGFEVTRKIRELEADDDGDSTPVIAWTANALRGDAEACFLAGMDDYLSKPAELVELKEKLDYWLPINGEDEGETPDSGAAPADDSGPIDRSVLAVIAGNDAASVREILSDFGQANESDVTSLEQAVSEEEAEAVRRAAHRIKGSSRMVGAKGLAEISEQLEHAAGAADWEGIHSGLRELKKELEIVDDYIRRV
ncbi:PAS domain-containing protein [Wenzhouxiangella sp. 15190]|uniref:PAS domain-containing protein n=1 Tax=Wenzhouxiangella sp. 15190 TaxID=2301225 RepID=UPI0015F2A51D|nr:PAS domain-containing protein [Wenzhouxiangella sp. 15190]